MELERRLFAIFSLYTVDQIISLTLNGRRTGCWVDTPRAVTTAANDAEPSGIEGNDNVILALEVGPTSLDWPER